MRFRWIIFGVLLPLLLAVFVGCSWFGDFTKSRADKAAYSIVEEKRNGALGQADPFVISAEDRGEVYNRLQETAGKVDYAEVGYTTPSMMISLPEALGVSFANARDYQTRKEALFAQALSLTDTRRDFSFLFDASGGAQITRQETGNDTPQGETVERVGSSNFGMGVKKTFATGAVVSVNLAENFARYLTNATRRTASNSFSFDIVQPLLNGAGSLVAREPLVQAERDMIYQVRSFHRYERDFAIGIISSYFGLLQSLDGIRNQRLDYESALYNAESTAAMASSGKGSELEADEARQRVLTAENALKKRKADYQAELDSFKVQLGLPIDLDVGPDPSELVMLSTIGLTVPQVTLQEAVTTALEKRLDLQTAEDEVADSQRGVRIALRNFLPNLDVGYKYRTSSSSDDMRLLPRFRDNEQTWSLDLALPLDWTPRRNRYRRALIVAAQSERAFEEDRQNVILEIRQSWAQMDYLRSSYKNQQESVRLAEKRLESAEVRKRLLGDVTQRTITDAQDALLKSRDALTANLVSYTIQRMRFWHEIERLEIDTENMWYR